jgi:predicted lysophospholipase L1 biosynthesis ABC-type transport system permease subunit
MTEWLATLPDKAPNNFLINMQPVERETLGAMLDPDRRGANKRPTSRHGALIEDLLLS